MTLQAQAFDLHPLHETLFEKEGLRKGEWDVGLIVTDWLAEAEQADSLADLAPFLNANPPEDYPAGWAPSLLRFQEFGKKILALPYHDGPECLIYRKDLFEGPEEKARFLELTGRPLSVPRTWEQFHEIARFFTRPKENLWGTIFAAYPDGHNTVYDFCLQLWTRGGDLFDADDRPLLNTPEARDALNYYREILKDPTAVHPSSRDCDSVNSGFAFAKGEIAMMVNWFGFAAMSETLESSRIKGKVAIAPVPSAENSSSVSLNAYWLLGIGSGSAHKEVAYAFLRHCAGRAADRSLTLGGGIGCRKSTWHDPEVNAAIPFYHRLEEIHTHARELPRLAHFPSLAKIIDEMMLAAINGADSIEDICQRAEADAKNISQQAGAAR